MGEFLRAVVDYPFMRHALLAGVLASIACGVVGSYVAVRRITYIAGGIAHCVLGGIGGAYYLRKTHGLEWLDPLYGAAAAALAAAMVIGLVSLRAKEREDTVISALWAIGMATGIIFISRTPGYNADLMSYLFGNILMVGTRDLWLIGGLDALVLAVGLLFYNQFLAICYDEEYARLRDIKVEFFYLLLLCITALTVVLLVTVVGIVLVVALLTLPIAVAGHFSRTLWQMMGLSVILSVIFTTTGLMLSYGPDLPSGATIIAVSGAAYVLVLLLKRTLQFRRS